MFVPACDRPSLADPTGRGQRPVMETKSAAIHRKMPAAARRLPITKFAHKTGVVGLPYQATIFAAFEVAAERCRAAGLDGAHDLVLDAPEMTPMGLTIGRAVVAEHVRHLKRRPHDAVRLSRIANASEAADPAD